MFWKKICELLGIQKREPYPIIPRNESSPLRQKDAHEEIQDLQQDLKLMCTLQNESHHSLGVVDNLKEKTRRRALRHFAGKEVRHRVTEKKNDSIEFSFFRGSGNPLKIKWQKNEALTGQT